MKKITHLAALSVISLIGFKFAHAQTLPQPALDHMPVCPPGRMSSVARCHARVVVDQNGFPHTSTSPLGLSPRKLHTGYSLPTTSPGNQLIAIVDAYDSPTVKADLDTASFEFGLPVMPDCVEAIASSFAPCFAKVDQRGGTNYPQVDGSWALEIALDVQTAHAVCQNCSILLVESDSNSFNDLMTALDQAVTQGARIISNSYGSSREFGGESNYDLHFNAPGYVFTFSSGDSGYGTAYPAASPFVTSVGGTTLNLDSAGNYIAETVWSGTGSGCSSIEFKPPFQTDTGCYGRTLNDVSAVADPSTGFSVYNSTPYVSQTGWWVVGGTSLSAPLIAGVYALAGGIAPNIMGNSVPYALVDYKRTRNMHDISKGSNGNCGKGHTIGGAYLCTAHNSFDGPTGLGTPRGVGAFHD